jgi:3-methyladenine DNA glycosylase AlkD
MYQKILKEIMSYKNTEKAEILARFFKTDKGQYGEGDLFLGIVVPISRKIAKRYIDVSFADIEKLIKNKYHEVRLVALLILVSKYQSLARQCQAESLAEQERIVNFYLKHTKYINNWDLVDLSAHYILGDYLYQRTIQKKDSRKIILFKLAKSKNLWERRIAIISTFAFLYKGESKWTIEIVKILIKDKHDLIHKACGWMLREAEKKVSEKELISFLNLYSSKMPRTMLRYAIERLNPSKKRYFLSKKN